MTTPQTDLEFSAWMREQYPDMIAYREYADSGMWAAVIRKMFHWSLQVGMIGDRENIADCWCYTADPTSAIVALTEWDGTNEPKGWQRHPATGRRRPNGLPDREYIQP